MSAVTGMSNVIVISLVGLQIRNQKLFTKLPTVELNLSVLVLLLWCFSELELGDVVFKLALLCKAARRIEDVDVNVGVTN